jgi:hypothetical protein
MNSASSQCACRWPLLLAGLVSLVNAGCLVFDKQTMVVVFPKDAGEVRVLMVYHGLHVSGKNDTDLERAKDQLAQLVRGEIFYMGDPLLRVCLKPGREDRPTEWDVAAMKTLNKHIVPGKGVFVADKDDRCAYCQPLTVRDPGPFVAWLNQIIGEELIDAIRAEPKGDKKLPPIMDKETKEMIERAAKQKFAFLRLDSGRIAFTLPGTRKFFADAKREIAVGNIADIKKSLEALADPAKKNAAMDALRKQLDDMDSTANLLADTPWSLDQRPNQITLAIGWGDGQPFQLTVGSGKRSKGNEQHTKDLHAFGKTLGIPVRNNASIDHLVESFQRTQTLEMPVK